MLASSCCNVAPILNSCLHKELLSELTNHPVFGIHIIGMLLLLYDVTNPLLVITSRTEAGLRQAAQPSVLDHFVSVTI